jgi:hypothetical protein
MLALMKNTQTILTNKNETKTLTSRAQPRRAFWLSVATALTSVAVIGYLGVQEAKALDSRLTNACTHALAGKCFHSGDLPQDLSGVYDNISAQNYCTSQIVQYCDIAECTDRVSVLAGIAASSSGDPCTP